MDDVLGRRAGMLLARISHSYTVGAAVVCLAADGDDVLTSDPASYGHWPPGSTSTSSQSEPSGSSPIRTVAA